MALNKSSVTHFGCGWVVEVDIVWADNIWLREMHQPKALGEIWISQTQQLHQDSSKITQSLNFFVRLNEFVIP